MKPKRVFLGGALLLTAALVYSPAQQTPPVNRPGNDPGLPFDLQGNPPGTPGGAHDADLVKAASDFLNAHELSRQRLADMSENERNGHTAVVFAMLHADLLNQAIQKGRSDEERRQNDAVMHGFQNPPGAQVPEEGNNP